jgi:plastocyanin
MMKAAKTSLLWRCVMCAVAISLGGLWLSGCGGYSRGGEAGATAPGPNEIWLKDHAFVPESMTVVPGTTITWINEDVAIHNVTSGPRGNPDGVFASGNLWHHAKFSHTFNEAGTFPYYCSIHSHMQGTIIVQK